MVDVVMDLTQEDSPVLKSSSNKGKSPVYFTSPTTLPFVEKYRPHNLSEIVSHKDILSTINVFIQKDRLPHLLFYGPPGTGKTTTILAIARQLYGEKYKNMTLELNASDDRGIDVVREQIKSFAESKTLFSSGFKLIVLDEADNMTQAAQSALRRVIEKYTRNVRFCIICNYVSKIIPAIQSRCTRFRFSPLQADQVEKRLDTIIQNEGIQVTQDGKDALIRLCQGDMRRALNVLQSTHAAYNLISEETVYTCTGSPLPKDIESIANSLFSNDYTETVKNVLCLQLEKGLALTDILTELNGFVTLMELPSHIRVYLLDQMASIEHALSVGSTEKLQLCRLAGVFKIGMDLAKS